eukprot:14135662-Alexandrium_andersonii.AAC.1
MAQCTTTHINTTRRSINSESSLVVLCPTAIVAPFLLQPGSVAQTSVLLRALRALAGARGWACVR